MKTANVLSASLLLVLGGLIASVGCATPPPATLNSDSADTTKGDDDDDTAPAKKASTSTPTDTTTTTTKAPATTTAGPSEAACNTCIGSNAEAKAFLTCDDACQDDACDTKCETSSNCGDGTACSKLLDTCQKQCFGDDTTTGTGTGTATGTGDDAACVACVGPSGPAADYIKCSDQCTDAKCDDACFSKSCGGPNGTLCDAKLMKCDAQCGGGDDDDNQQ